MSAGIVVAGAMPEEDAAAAEEYDLAARGVVGHHGKGPRAGTNGGREVPHAVAPAPEIGADLVGGRAAIEEEGAGAGVVDGGVGVSGTGRGALSDRGARMGRDGGDRHDGVDGRMVDRAHDSTTDEGSSRCRANVVELRATTDLQSTSNRSLKR